MEKTDKLKRENRLLKETCEVLADKGILKNIRKSLEEIKEGKFIPLSKL
jgi:uncharacterized protein (UPF0147 family)